MTDATDDLETLAYFGTNNPVRDLDGTWYVYIHKGKKYSFRTVEAANEWAKSKGFKLTTTVPTEDKSDNA